MKKSILFLLIFVSSFVKAQFKFDIGLTLMGTLKKNITVGEIRTNSGFSDTTYSNREYQTGSFGVYIKPAFSLHPISKELFGMVSFPMNAGISSVTTSSGTAGNSTTFNFEYDGAILYGIGGGTYQPKYFDVEGFGYFFNAGIGFLRFTQEPDYDEPFDDKPSKNVIYHFSNDENPVMRKMNIGPVVQAGFQFKFPSLYSKKYSKVGLAIAYRPALNNGLTFIQLSSFIMLK